MPRDSQTRSARLASIRLIVRPLWCGRSVGQRLESAPGHAGHVDGDRVAKEGDAGVVVAHHQPAVLILRDPDDRGTVPAPRCCLCPQCARTPTPHPSTRTAVPGEESLAEAAGARLARERDPVSLRYFVAEISTTLLGGET